MSTSTDVDQGVLTAQTLDFFTSTCKRFETPCDTGTMVWRNWGVGRPIILLHGGHGTWTHWIRNIGPLLKQGMAVWAPDLPGMGESAEPPYPWTPDSYSEIIHAGSKALLGEQKYDLVGFSLGGLMAGCIAGLHPESVRNLVLVDAAAMGMQSAARPLSEGGTMRVWRGVENLAERMDIHRYNLCAHMFHNPALADDLAVTLQMVNVETDRLRGREVVRSGDWLYQILAQVRCPVHAIWGKQDAVYRDQEGLLAALRARKVASMRFFDEAGHWSQFEKADEFNAALREILAH